MSDAKPAELAFLVFRTGCHELLARAQRSSSADHSLQQQRQIGERGVRGDLLKSLQESNDAVLHADEAWMQLKECWAQEQG